MKGIVNFAVVLVCCICVILFLSFGYNSSKLFKVILENIPVNEFQITQLDLFKILKCQGVETIVVGDRQFLNQFKSQVGVQFDSCAYQKIEIPQINLHNVAHALGGVKEFPQKLIIQNMVYYWSDLGFGRKEGAMANINLVRRLNSIQKQANIFSDISLLFGEVRHIFDNPHEVSYKRLDDLRYLSFNPSPRSYKESIWKKMQGNGVSIIWIEDNHGVETKSNLPLYSIFKKFCPEKSVCYSSAIELKNNGEY